MTNACKTHTHLISYLDAVNACIDQTIRQAGLHPEQVELLLSKNKMYPYGVTKVLAHPLAPFYLAVRAHGIPVGVDAEAIGAGFLLFHRSLCLLDDVQDHELAEPYVAVDDGVAINCGLALFFLGIDMLWAAECEGPMAGTWDLRSSLRCHTLRLCRGQHGDLTGRGLFRTPAAALNIAMEKTAICTLLIEYAAIYAAAAAPSRRRVDLEPYRVIGDAFAQMQQIVNDVADLFGTSDSQDLHTGTWNVPLTMLLATLPEEARASWAARLRAADRHDVCRLLYDTKAMAHVAAVTEAARLRIHQTFAQLPCGGPYLAMLLAWLDDLVALLYKPRVLPFSVDIETMDSADLHPADAVLFEQLRAACSAARSAHKTRRPNDAHNSRPRLCEVHVPGQ